jgi:LPS-assembly protein
MRGSLTAHTLFAGLLSLLSLAAGRGPALAADSFGLGLERLKSAGAATHVEAGQLEYQEQRKVVIGRGDVMVRFGDRILYADELRVDLQTQEFVATGHVLLVEGPNRLEGDRLEFNYGTNLGVFYNARGFLYPSTSFRGLEIRKVSEREYRVLQGAFTSCRVCQPEPSAVWWEFRSEEATLIQDVEFVATNASAWALDTLPVFYSPAVSVPLGPRRSGFLLPRVATGNTSGFTYRQPFFWAISDSQDATFKGTYATKRGYELDADYRYILSPRASGEWSGSYYKDHKSSSGDENRWEVHGVHEQLFAPTLSLKAAVNYQSDNTLARDFLDHTLIQRTARTIQSNVFVTQAAEVYDASLWTAVSRDLENTQNAQLARLPEFRFYLFDRPLLSNLPLTLGGRGSATYFQGTGSTETDTARVDFAPRVGLPWAPAPWLGLAAAGGLRETIYSGVTAGSTGSPTRTIFDAGASAEARFLRVFEVGGRELSQLVHVVAPRVGYQYVPYVDQQRYPQLDLDDFIAPQNRITYGLDNRFIARFRDEEGRITSREVLRLGVAQSFDFRPRTRAYADNYLTALTPERVDNAVVNAQEVLNTAGNPTGFSQATERQFSNLVFSVQASPHPLIALRSDVALNTTNGAEEATNVQGRLRYPGWGYLGLGYTHVQGQSLEAYIASVGASLTPEFSVEYLFRYDARRRVFLENNVLARYETCCWEVSVRYINVNQGPGIGTRTSFQVQFGLKTGRAEQAPGTAPPLTGGPGCPPGASMDAPGCQGLAPPLPGPSPERPDAPAPGAPPGGSGGLVDGPPASR